MRRYITQVTVNCSRWSFKEQVKVICITGFSLDNSIQTACALHIDKYRCAHIKAALKWNNIEMYVSRVMSRFYLIVLFNICGVFSQSTDRSKAWLAEPHSVPVSRVMAPTATILWFPFLPSNSAPARPSTSFHWDASAWPECTVCILCIVMKRRDCWEVNKSWNRVDIQSCELHRVMVFISVDRVEYRKSWLVCLCSVAGSWCGSMDFS